MRALSRLTTMVCLMASVHAPLVFAGVYKWTDAEGKTHFSDKPPPQQKAEALKLQINTYDGASQIRPSGAETPEVIMYSAAWCGVCKDAKRYFQAQGIRYTEYDVEKSEKGATDFRRLGGKGVPIILRNGKRMDGFSPERFEAMSAPR